MPNPGLDKPIKKVTINLYEEDVLALQRSHPQGWSTIIREVLHDYLRPKRTVGDLDA